MLATWAVGDQVFIGIMGGEAESPRFSMAHATKLVPFRVNFIYITSVIFLTILVPSNDKRLLGASSVAASPFIIAVEDSGIPGIGSLLNAGMMCGVLAIAAESIYLSSRVLRTMAHQKLIPERLARVDDKGRPRLALAITCFVAVVLAYVQLSGRCSHSGQVQGTCRLMYISWWSDGPDLAGLNYQRVVLHELDYHIVYELALPCRLEGTE